MQQLIASYFAQKKQCSLPLLGKLRIVSKPAVAALVDFQITKPEREIAFDPKDDYLEDDLIEYISFQQQVSRENAEEMINNWCLNSKMRLDEGEKIPFKSFGHFQNSEAGHVIFQARREPDLYSPVSSKKVIHEQDQHSILVGDKETTTAAMNEYFEEAARVEVRKKIKLWVPLLAGAALVFLILYFLSAPISLSAIGNQSGIPLTKIPSQYSLLP